MAKAKTTKTTRTKSRRAKAAEAFDKTLNQVKENIKSQHYSTGYRVALFDPLDDAIPLVNIQCGYNNGVRTHQKSELESLRPWIDFANDVLVTLSSRYQVGIFPAAVTGFAGAGDGEVRAGIPQAQIYHDYGVGYDDDEEGGQS